ncbi:MAG: TolC family protein, partial [Pseudomonadota bacterium]
ERDLRQAWQGLRAGRERMPNLAMHARSSAQVVEAYRKQFQIGQRSLLDLLNSEAERYGAQAAVLNGVYTVSADEHRLLAAMGKLVAALGVPRPGEAEAENAAAR